MSPVAALMMIVATAGAAMAPPLHAVDGAPAPGAAAGRVLLLWRSDCGPCLMEMADLPALRAAARPLRLDPLALDAPDRDAPALRRMGLKPSDSLHPDEDPATLLTRLGGAPPRLPLSAAFRADGSLCAAHSGMVGRDQMRRWALQCAGPDALR